MAVDSDEETARATLAEMQMRLASGPYAVLSIAPNVSAGEARSAFLELTKLYHPARFSRMSSEIQRLANEVFLGIKSAHEALAKQSGWSTRGQPSGSQPPASQVQTAIPGRTPAVQTGAVPTQIPRAASAGTSVPTRTGPLPTHGSPTTPPSGIRISPGPSQPPAQSRTSTAGTRLPPAAPPSGTVQATQPTQVPRSNQTPAAGRPVTSGIPTANNPPTSRPTTPSPAPVVGRAQTPMPAAPRNAPATVQPWKASASSGPAAASGPRPGVFDERSEFMTIMDLVRKNQWPAARAALQNLSSRVPNAQNYKALLAYARGREAQQAGRDQDAILELQRALQLDPNLSLAKTALVELQSKRK